MVEATARALIGYIASNRLKAGDQLPSERELVDMTGVSRLPLREALCILKGLGLVEAKHGKGIFVRRLDMAAVFGMLSPLLKTQADTHVNHIFEARLHLEAGIANLAAQHRAAANLQALQAALDGMRANFSDDQELANSARNPVFHVIMAAITDLLREVHLMYKDKVEYRKLAIREHEAILDAVRERDGERAETAMQTHLENAKERV
jgi:GntR family transcriptional repressor for pyruvate dehydrogenase complex